MKKQNGSVVDFACPPPPNTLRKKSTASAQEISLTLGAAFLGFGSGLGGAGFCTKHT